MTKRIGKKTSELVRSDDTNGAFGTKKMSQHHTKGGISSLISTISWLNDISDQELEDIPDHVLSDNLDKDMDSSVSVCALGLKRSKYFPERTRVFTWGVAPEGHREGVTLERWQDFNILNFQDEPLYTKEDLASASDENDEQLAFSLSLIVKDICDDGGMLSAEWYEARILYEYFRKYPIPRDSAYLIGELFKELCSKEQFEGDLSAYYSKQAEEQRRRQKGAKATEEKALELRYYCVAAFVDLADRLGARFVMAPSEVQATELRKKVLAERPNDFQRGGKPYRKEWFLRHVLEDMKLEIIDAIDNLKKG